MNVGEKNKQGGILISPSASHASGKTILAKGKENRDSRAKRRTTTTTLAPKCDFWPGFKRSISPDQNGKDWLLLDDDAIFDRVTQESGNAREKKGLFRRKTREKKP